MNPAPPAARNRSATDNAAIYDRLWAELTPFIRYNPGARHRRRWLFSRLDGPYRAGAVRSVLDVGCGNAELLRLAMARYPRVERFAGLDLSEAVLRANRTNLPSVRFVSIDVQREALAGEPPFDAVLCTEVLEHLDEQEAALRNLYAMCAPGGRLLLTCPTGTLYATEKHFGHVAHPTPRALVRSATRAGFALVSLRNWGFPVYRATKWATNIDPAWALETFVRERYGVGQIALSTLLYYANFLNAPSSPAGCQLFAELRRPA